MNNGAKPNHSQKKHLPDLTREPAFTLIELVMVLGTVGLLGLLILPALARSSDQGGRTVCANNLRQLGMASKMYADDNRDYLAYPNWGNATGWQGWLYTTVGGIPNNGIPDPGPWGTYATNKIAAYQTGLWFQYVRDPNTYLCPVDIESVTYIGRPDGGNLTRLQRLSSYIMNGAVCGYLPTYRSSRVADVWNPACYLAWNPDENFLGPGNPGAFDYNDGANFPNNSEGIDRLHTSAGGFVLTAGGNVQFVSRIVFQSQGSAPVGRKNLAWWSPFSNDGH